MKKVHVQQTDAFTTKIFGGNPAGVVLDANNLTDEEMKNIAREMNLSETAFLLTPTQKDADIKLRYFTSGKAEIKFCGHATIAALYEIGRTGMFNTEENGEYTFRIETNAGILPMTIIKKFQNDIAVRFIAPQVQFEHYKSQHEEFAKRLGIPVEVINKKHPIMIDRNLNYIYLAINSLKELGDLQFNFQHIIDNFKEEGIVIFCLITPETVDKNNDVHARGLAPLVGVPEDPFTGSMQASLATYCRENGLVAEDTKQIRSEQGNFIDRPGFAVIDLPEDENETITVSGNAAHVFSTEIQL
jgi:trans-2,3-dihydro-3-hydroxyanthranilate isomerase